MDTSRNFMLQCLLSAAAVVAVAGVSSSATAARADTINIQLTASGGPSFNGSQGAFTGDGVAAPIWNVNYGTDGANNLIDSAGSATAVAYTLAFNSGDSSNFYYQTSSSLPTLLNGYAFVNNNNGYASPQGTIELTGLASNGEYQLFLYAQNTSYDSEGATFAVTQGTGGPAGSGASVTNTGSDTAFALGKNYIIFDAAATATGDLGISWTPLSGGTEGDINGLQVTTVPEPASLGLLALGGLGLLMVSRRRATRQST